MASTYVVELTPPGRAAVSVVLVAGADAARIVRELFTPVSGRRLAELPIGRIALGHWGGAEGEELIVCRRGEERIEIHCHGGTAAVGAVMLGLVERGCQRMTWQEWLRLGCQRASPRLGSASAAADASTCIGDATTCAAQIALAEAPTQRVAGVLLDQYDGALSNAIRSAKEAIEAGNWAHARETLDSLLRYRELGLHLTAPWRVVLAGAPNVGKSSLVNALAGYERAIVSPQPGTTRDVVTATTAIAGWPVQLADTAGLGEAADELESAGMALAAGALRNSDLVIVVEDVDGTGPAKIVSTPPHVRVLHVRNKIDLLDAAARQATGADAAIATSTVTGEGLAELVEAIARTLVPVNPQAGAAVPFTVQQVAGLESVRTAIGREDASEAVAALDAVLTGES